MVNKVAIISGISGQDGSYMAESLLLKGYSVYGLTRQNTSLDQFINLKHLTGDFRLIQTNYEQSEINDLIRNINPGEIYNFTGQSYVSKSWNLVEETIFSQGIIASRFLVAIEKINPSIKFLNTSSAEVFGINANDEINQNSFIAPYNPYGCGQSLGHLMVDSYRKNKGIYAVNAVLFPHESPRRSPDFAFQKIISTAVSIKKNMIDELKIGNLDVERDWSYAPSFIESMINMLSLHNPENFFLCSGKTHSIREIVSIVFDYLDLDWEKYVTVDKSLMRFYEPQKIVGNPEKAFKCLELSSSILMNDIIKNIIDFEIINFNNNNKNFKDEIFL